MKAFFISIPHSGEQIPPEVTWLKDLPEAILMCDVDRYVDQLYAPALSQFHIPAVVAETHRYVIDLNRVPEDIDQDSVAGSANPSGSFTTGLHWSKTTTGAVLLSRPLTRQLHESLVEKYFHPFHRQIQGQVQAFRAQGQGVIYHLDAHSMPSVGTSAHRDPGQTRAQIVVSDQDGTSCSKEFKDIVIESYRAAGFDVAYNWPYKGGRITQAYGRPQQGHHTIQVEMNRSLYMDESTKQKKLAEFKSIQLKVKVALEKLKVGLEKI